jgi:hypothetical protein
MTSRRDTSRPIEQRLLEEPRRTAGVDSSRQPVRLGERDSSGHLVGYIDDHGLAWQSLIERIVAVHGQRLAQAIALPYDHPGRDHLMDDALAEVPDELLGDIAQEAAAHLWLSHFGREPDSDERGDEEPRKRHLHLCHAS